MNRNHFFALFLSAIFLVTCTLDEIDDAVLSCPSPPQAAFTTDKTSGGPPLTIAFTNTSTGAASYAWDFGNGQTSTVEEPGTRQYTLAGDYTVRLIAKTAAGCPDTFTTLIQVDDPKLTRTFGGPNNDYGYAVQQTSDGGYIMLGNTNSTGAGQDDVYLVKTDNNMAVVWERTYGGVNWDYGKDVQQTSDGGYILLGDTDSEGAGGRDLYLIKTNSNGTLTWKTTFGGTGGEYGESVQQTSDGGYILLGFTFSSGAGQGDVYLVKTDAAGNREWENTYGGTKRDDGYSVQQTSDGGYILLGKTESSGAGSEDIYLIRIGKLGNVIWETTFGTTGQEGGRSVQQTADGGFIVLGYTLSVSWWDIKLIKTNSSGNPVWEKTFGAANNDDFGYSVQQTVDGGYAVLGYTRSQGAGYADMYLFKTNNLGTVLWEKTYGGPNDDLGFSVQQTVDQGFILMGYTESYGAGNRDMYLVKTDINGVAQ